MTEFTPFPKVPRLSREIVVTEKIDGTNASIWIEPVVAERPDENVIATVYVTTPAEGGGHINTPHFIRAGSRTRFLMPEGDGRKGTDNFGFAAWVRDYAEELVALGEGVHYGEWWGKGIQRNYGLSEKRFSLFNTNLWDLTNLPPACCSVVPALYRGEFSEREIEGALGVLYTTGSYAAPGFKKPEGVIIYHTAARQLFKKTLERDEIHKGGAG